jgi:hypothetical protein
MITILSALVSLRSFRVRSRATSLVVTWGTRFACMIDTTVMMPSLTLESL